MFAHAIAVLVIAEHHAHVPNVLVNGNLRKPYRPTTIQFYYTHTFYAPPEYSLSSIVKSHSSDI